MSTTPVYLLQILGNPTIEISQDDLRTLLGEIESELHRSKVYRRAVAMSQNLLDLSTEQANVLFKAVGREAIGLAFRKFVQQYQKLEERQYQQDGTNDIALAEKTNSTDDLLPNLTSAVTQEATLETDSNETNNKAHVPLQSEGESNIATADAVETKQEPAKTKTSSGGWFGKKQREAELAKQMAAEQRIETLRQIGQQLRQARESQGLSLAQLHVYTHVPLHHMEAVEDGNWELLPEEVYVRGFIRIMANALGLNGTNLAATLPAPEPVKTILPTWYQYKSQFGFGVAIRPVHLYLGYAALVAGSVGGLSVMSSQQANANRLIHTDAVTPPSSSHTQSSQETKPTSKPGLSSSAKVIIGPDLAPPEAL